MDMKRPDALAHSNKTVRNDCFSSWLERSMYSKDLAFLSLQITHIRQQGIKPHRASDLTPQRWPVLCLQKILHFLPSKSPTLDNEGLNPIEHQTRPYRDDQTSTPKDPPYDTALPIGYQSGWTPLFMLCYLNNIPSFFVLIIRYGSKMHYKYIKIISIVYS